MTAIDTDGGMNVLSKLRALRCGSIAADLMGLDSRDLDQWLADACRLIASMSDNDLAITAHVCLADDAGTRPTVAHVACAGIADAHATTLVDEARRGCHENDIWFTPALLRGTQTRTVRRSDIISDQDWQTSRYRDLLASVGIRDLAVVIIPIESPEPDRSAALVLEVGGLDAGWTANDCLLLSMEVIAPVIRMAMTIRFLRPLRHRHELLGRLSPTQRRIAPMLADGMTEKEIAEALERSPHTVHEHAKSIYSSWNVRSRFDLRRKWFAGA